MVTLNFGSFPRSANHYTYEALRQAFGQDRVNNSWHSISLLAQADNPITTVRSPFGCVPSWIVFNNDKRPNRVDYILEWYCAFYESCIKVEPLVLSFDQITNDISSCLSEVSSYFGIEQIKKPVLDLSTGFHVPTLDRSQYDSIILEMEQSKLFDYAMSIYSKVASRCA